jgi:hypothetical protein
MGGTFRRIFCAAKVHHAHYDIGTCLDSGARGITRARNPKTLSVYAWKNDAALLASAN